MPRIDHHEKPYDEGTLNKLEIFSSYVESWLPTFIMQPHISEVNIVDFFAGLGYDSDGIPGTPILILKKIDGLFGLLMRKNTKINLYLNEYKIDKYTKLKENCEAYLESHKRLSRFVTIHFSNKDFNDIYLEIIHKTFNHPNLFLIDQSGIKFTNQKNFNTLLQLKTTDFLFFISSSFFKRFNEREEFKDHIHLDEVALKHNPYNFIHRLVLETYRSLIPNNSNLKIFPFSIKKGSNIYGIIFGSKHIRGVEKFLQIAWNKSKINGEADFDIDEDIAKEQYELDFDNSTSNKRLTKIEIFQKKLELFIEENGEVTSHNLYYYTYEQGHIAKHTREKLSELRKTKKIHFKGHSKISWNYMNNKKLVTFKWIG